MVRRFLRKIFKRLSDNKGQTMVEYILLMAMVAITTYLMVKGPVARFTQLAFLGTIRGGIGNVIRNGEMKSGQIVDTGQAGHPGDPARAKALH
jgi:Flp pilus assembly pilin Flp